MTLLLLLPPLTAATTEPQDKKKKYGALSQMPAQSCTFKMGSPLSTQRSVSDDFSHCPPVARSDPELQRRDSLFWSRCCWPEVRDSTSQLRNSFQLPWSGRTSWPLPHSASGGIQVVPLHAPEPNRAMVCFTIAPLRPQWAPAGDCIFPEAGTSLACDF